MDKEFVFDSEKVEVFVEDCEYWGYENVSAERKADGTLGWLIAKKKRKWQLKRRLEDLFMNIVFCASGIINYRKLFYIE